MATIPLYQTVYLKVKKLIRDGEYEIGEFLPSEGELETQYEVSRTTIRKVINMLVSEGYLEVRQGRGTRVVDFHSTQNLNGVTSISETLKKKGIVTSVKSIYIDKVEAGKHTAERLNIKEFDLIYRVQRVQLADGVPISIMENYIPCDCVLNLEYKTNEIDSFYGFLESEYGINIDYAKDIISAKSADFAESQMLDVKAGSALLTLRRVTYSNGRPITYDKIIIRADKYRFELEMVGRNK